MNRQIKDKWISALRSGEYNQDSDGGYLKTCDGYCCLGVLCDLYVKETGKEWERVEETGYSKLGGMYDFLPEEVITWAEMENPNPLVHYSDEDVNHEGTITDLNDSGVPFDVLASLIEEQVPVTA